MMLNKHNPDVLSCLANLSNDEVFTPPEVANRMLDMLPQELFESAETTFLDPCCKSGVFLREIAKRLLKNQMPGYEKALEDIKAKKEAGEKLSPEDKYFQNELQKVVDHIFHKQLFGIAITEMTSLLSRRSVYCAKNPDSKYSISKFERADGNIRFKKIKHTWVDGKCKYCGANEEQYRRGDELESHAYEWIHTNNLEGIFGMKFDVIIGNPPYHLSDGSGASTDAANPIYQLFISQAKKLQPNYLVMITPSKWMVGGKISLKPFREQMRSDTRIKKIVDYENAAAWFPGIHIDGGISYFLWDRNYHGKTDYTFISNDGQEIKSFRYLKNDFFEYIIRDSRIFDILLKIKCEEYFSSIVSSTQPFGIRKDLFNSPERYPNSRLSEHSFTDSVRIYGVKGIKGGARRQTGYITKVSISDTYDALNKFKLFFTTSYSTNAIIPPEIIIGDKGDACTETFLLIGPFNTKSQQCNCKSFMETKFFRFLLYHGKGTMQVSKTVFGLIPLLDFNEEWSDEKLINKYGLQREKKFIDSFFNDKEDA